MMAESDHNTCPHCAGTGKLHLEHSTFGCGDCDSSGRLPARVLTPDEAAYAKRLAGEELYFALVRTWAVIEAAGLHNLTRGVQLGQTSWFVKASDARESSMRAIAKARGESA